MTITTPSKAILLQTFKAEVQAYHQAAARQSNNHSRSKRRLDSLARLLEGGTNCCAVYLDAQSSKLLIFNNSIFENSRGHNQTIQGIRDILKLVQETNLTAQELIAGVTQVTIDARGQSSVRTTLPGLTQIIVEQVRQGQWFRDFPSATIPALEKEIEDYLQEIFTIPQTLKAWKEAWPATDTATMRRVKQSCYKLVRDFMKLRQVILATSRLSYELQALKQALQQGTYEIVPYAEKQVHAEMRAVGYLWSKLAVKTGYIGISKLCCQHCQSIIKGLPYETRGAHGQAFNWVLPRYLSNTHALTLLMGQQAFAIYQQLDPDTQADARAFLQTAEIVKEVKNAKQGARMEPDSSDSDVEIGLEEVAESEETTEAWLALNLVEQQTYRVISNHYPEASQFLREALDYCFEDIIYLYQQNEEMFENVLCSESIDFMQNYAEEQDETLQEVFAALQNIYKKSSRRFYSILSRAEKIIDAGFTLSDCESDAKDSSDTFSSYTSPEDDGEDSLDNKLAAAKRENDYCPRYRSDDSQNIATSDSDEARDDFYHDSEEEQAIPTDEDEGLPDLVRQFNGLSLAKSVNFFSFFANSLDKHACPQTIPPHLPQPRDLPQPGSP